jgi:hypothetical protein
MDAIKRNGASGTQALNHFFTSQTPIHPKYQNMKLFVTPYEAAEIMLRACNNFSKNGALILMEWIEEMEEDTGPYDLDIISLRCDYSEYQNAMEAASMYGWCPAPDEFDTANEAAAAFWLSERTQIRPFLGGIIIADF